MVHASFLEQRGCMRLGGRNVMQVWGEHCRAQLLALCMVHEL